MEMAARGQLYSMNSRACSLSRDPSLFLQTLWLPPCLLPVTLAACNAILYLRLRLMSDWEQLSEEGKKKSQSLHSCLALNTYLISFCH